MQVVKPPIRQIQAKFSIIKAQTHAVMKLWNTINETCNTKPWNSCWVHVVRLQRSQLGIDVAILSCVLAWMQVWELQGICWFCCPCFCSRKERASGLCFGKCIAVLNNGLVPLGSRAWLAGADTLCRNKPQARSPPAPCYCLHSRSPFWGFFDLLLLLLVIFCCSFLSSQPLQVKKSAQRTSFSPSFFSFVHPPQYHQDNVKRLISFLSDLGA